MKEQLEHLFDNQNYVGVVFIIVADIFFKYCVFRHKISLVSVDKVQYGANYKDQNISNLMMFDSPKPYLTRSLSCAFAGGAARDGESGRRSFTMTSLLFYHKAMPALSPKITHLSSTELWFWWSDFRFLYPSQKDVFLYFFHHNFNVLHSILYY